jgi:hypothetical protein
VPYWQTSASASGVKTLWLLFKIEFI